MENIKTNGFAEMSVSEMQTVDGGAYHWYDIVLSYAPGIGPVYAVGIASYELFMLGYRNGYNSTRG